MSCRHFDSIAQCAEHNDCCSVKPGVIAEVSWAFLASCTMGSAQWPQDRNDEDKHVFQMLHAARVSEGAWRNGSASDSRSAGWEFESLCPHFCVKSKRSKSKPKATFFTHVTSFIKQPPRFHFRVLHQQPHFLAVFLIVTYSFRF